MDGALQMDVVDLEVDLVVPAFCGRNESEQLSLIYKVSVNVNHRSISARLAHRIN